MRTKNPITVLGPTGGPLSGATVTTYLRLADGTAGALASAYTTPDGATAASNPATTDASGRINQWLERGRYLSVVAHGSLPGGGYPEAWDSSPGGNDGIDADWIDTTASSNGLVAVKQASGEVTWQTVGAPQLADQSLKTIAGLTPAADRVPYYTGASAAALATLTAAGRTLIASTRGGWSAWTGITYATGYGVTWGNEGGSVPDAQIRTNSVTGEVQLRGTARLNAGAFGFAAVTAIIMEDASVAPVKQARFLVPINDAGGFKAAILDMQPVGRLILAANAIAGATNATGAAGTTVVLDGVRWSTL